MDYIFILMDRAGVLFSGNIQDIPVILLHIIGDFDWLIVRLVAVIIVIVLGQYAIRYSYRVRILYYSLLTGITSASFYQAMMNIDGIQNGDLALSSSCSTIGSVILMVLCVSGGIFAIYQPWNKVKLFNMGDRIGCLRDKPYLFASFLIAVSLVLSLIIFTCTLFPLNGPATSSGTIDEILNDISSLFSPGQPSAVQSDSVIGVDPLFVLVASSVAIIAAGSAISFFVIVELSVPDRIRRLVEGVRSGLASIRTARTRLSVQETLPVKPVAAPARPDYKDDIRHLQEISEAVGFYDEQYIDMANHLSRKHGVDTSQILYDQWAMVK